MTFPTSSHQDFKLISQQAMPSLGIEVQHYQHKKTGAIHYHLAHHSDENVFLVAFRTQPMDSTGKAHILEHTVLCGSQQFPVRDPFFLMIRRSLNTFMNAFTSSDWTAYPFATQNIKDYDNLLAVYLDAVFAPNLNPLDFAQEGIRIELENEQAVYKGVVFNEMKGAMSSPSSQLYYHLAHHLYPHTTYHYNSGGDPKNIPDLTYEQLVEFYQSHYHPSNSVFMTFGNRPVDELHSQFAPVLAKFERGETLHSTPETRLTAPIQVVEQYANDGGDLSDKTYHLLAWLLPQASDLKVRLGMRLVEGVLLENSASPLRHYLETCDYAQATSPMMGIDDSNFEMTFYCGVQGSNPEHAEQFEQGVFDILRDVASKPADPELIEAILHQIELHQREVSGDGMPYGLNVMLQGLNAPIHHYDPISLWDVDSALNQVKQELQDPMWVSNLIQTYLIDNPHRVRLTLQPDNEVSKREQQAELDRLADITAKLTDDDKAKIHKQTEDLRIRQNTPDDLDLLPKVGLDDIPADLHIVQGQLREILVNNTDVPLNLYTAGTNGLYYQQVLIHLDDDVINSPYFSILTILMGEVGAGEWDYLTLQQLQTAHTGGIGMGVSTRSVVNDKDKISAWTTLTTKSLTSKLDAISLLKTTFEQLRFDEKERIIELLQQRKNRWQSQLSGVAHQYAMQTASRHHSALENRDYANTGLPAFVWLRDTLAKIEQDDVAYQQFIDAVQAIHQRLLTAKKQFLLVCEAQQSERLLEEVQNVWYQLQQPQQAKTVQQVARHQNTQHQAWLMQANVQFCATAYPAVDVSHPDAVPFMVLGGYLRNGFLHSAIREQGGAYGGGAGYDGNACSFRFYSYRDPRLTETFADFDHAINWLLNEPQQPHQLEEAILGLIASMDKPGSPAGEAIGACYAYLHQRTPTFRKAMRQKILNVTLEDLQRIAREYLRPELASKSVVAPFNQRENLEQLGFEVFQID
ncbi:insulinase family protein [Moraxella sp. ZY210820]|uniref:insulinase family protein n=1 Tax=unclassified Moraxella TaxID=2685852 RepID=UPI00272F0D96|nr:insulinase family protein [Moraxella sp. ZY210820]WLF84975.1 insulinase family protein [Moraxella sp. ZY210820]